MREWEGAAKGIGGLGGRGTDLRGVVGEGLPSTELRVQRCTYCTVHFFELAVTLHALITVCSSHAAYATLHDTRHVPQSAPSNEIQYCRLLTVQLTVQYSVVPVSGVICKSQYSSQLINVINTSS